MSWLLVISLLRTGLWQWLGDERHGMSVPIPITWRPGKSRQLKVSGPQPGSGAGLSYQERTLVWDGKLGRTFAVCMGHISGPLRRCSGQIGAQNLIQVWGGWIIAVPTRGDPVTGHSWSHN